MNEYVKYFKDWWHPNDGASAKLINELEANEGFFKTLPHDYKEFVMWSNGGEGDTAFRYFTFWKIETLVAQNHDYCIQDFLPEFVAIGDDGSNFLVIDKSGRVYRTPFGYDDSDMLEVIAENFGELLINIRNID